MFKDYYAILEVSQDTTADEIRSSYKRLALKWHPDRNVGKDVTGVMQDINEAYNVLKDENIRTRYDEQYKEFLKFRKQHNFASSSTNQDSTNAKESNNSSTTTHQRQYSSHKHAYSYHSSNYYSRYSYQYDYKDDNLKDDINRARQSAEDYVARFMNDFKETSKRAAKGAWEGMRSYIIGGIVFSIIVLCMQTCSQ
jgi:curved DNA-binding protein CbpA